MLRTWIHGDRPDAPQTRIDVLTDCHSLVDSMSQVVPTSTEKRLRLDLLAIKESVDSGVINILRWVDTRLQMGDSLTKAASDEVRQTFIHALQSGRFFLVYSGMDSPPTTKQSDSQRILLALTALLSDR